MRLVLLAAVGAVGAGCGGLEGRGESTASSERSTASEVSSSSVLSSSSASTSSPTSNASSSCGSAELLCAASCIPPAYRCQPAELACLGCPPLPQDGGSAGDDASADAGGDAAACGPGLILCPDACGGPCWPGPKCPVPCLK